MNRFFAQNAYYNSIEFIGNTSVVINEDLNTIAYFTLVQTSIDFPTKPIECIEIARLATSLDFQQQGVGTNIINKVKNLSLQTNNRFISIDALKSEYSWYEGRGFLPIKQEELLDSYEQSFVYMYHDLYREDIIDLFFEE